jgi:hypothetical protein
MVADFGLAKKNTQHFVQRDAKKGSEQLQVENKLRASFANAG